MALFDFFRTLHHFKKTQLNEDKSHSESHLQSSGNVKLNVILSTAKIRYRGVCGILTTVDSKRCFIYLFYY